MATKRSIGKGDGIAGDVTKKVTGKESSSLLRSMLTLEPALVAHMTGVLMGFMVVQDLLLEKVCRVNLGYSDKVCDALQAKNADAYAVEEKETQKLMGTVIMYRTIIENAFPIVLVFLVGAWSDKYGRKLPILFVILAFLIQNVLLILCVYFTKAAGAWSVVIASSLIASLAGNQACFMMAAFSHISDITPVEKRTVRSGITHSCIFLGVTLGMAAGAIASKSGIGFVNSLLISGALEVFAFLYFLVMLTSEGQPGFRRGKSYKQILGELFDFSHIKDSMNSVFKKREGNTRLKLGLLLLAHTCTFMPFMGEMGVNYLFCRLKFNWDGAAYGTWATYKMVLGFLSNFVSMGLLTQRLKLSDPANGMVACASTSVTSLLLASASSSFMMYLAPWASLLAGAGAAMIIPRSTISKIIPTNELGKVNSFIGSLESIIPLIASSVYTHVYTSFLDVLPESFYLLSVGILVIPFLIHWWFLNESRSSKKIK